MGTDEGLCDTYCVLQFEDDKRRVPFKAKTITIMNDSEPVFNQRFIVPLMDVRSDVLRIEIWDKDVFQDELIGYVLVKIWDVLHLVRDDPEIITMGLDGDLLRISLALTAASDKYDVADYGSSVYLSITAENVKGALQHAQEMMGYPGSQPKPSNTSASLASTNSSPVDSLGQKLQASADSMELAKASSNVRMVVAGTKGRLITPQHLQKLIVPDTIPGFMKNDARLMAEFRRHDIDVNGVITKDELDKVYNRLQELGLTNDRAEFESTCTLMGFGDDCRITYEEFVVLMGKFVPLMKPKMNEVLDAAPLQKGVDVDDERRQKKGKERIS
uniref:Uncharacterized protein n=1 Tax=Eutreptiella gymnastica TaxID=73025 RepID=A0A7S4CZB3_9EUGL